MSLECTASKEVEFTDIINLNPAETSEPEKHYEEESVINSISQLATVKGRDGRIFNQSQGANTEKMVNIHDTRTRIDTRHYQTNRCHLCSHFSVNQSKFFDADHLLVNTIVVRINGSLMAMSWNSKIVETIPQNKRETR